MASWDNTAVMCALAMDGVLWLKSAHVRRWESGVFEGGNCFCQQLDLCVVQIASEICHLHTECK